MRRSQVIKLRDKDLRRSGFTREQIADLDYEPLLPGECKALTSYRVPAYRIGQRVRFLAKVINRYTGKPQRYWQPGGSGVLIYTPKLRATKPNGKRALLEGEKKGELYAARGYEVIAICGYRAYGTKKGDTTLHPDLRAFARETVLVVLDGNAAERKDIGEARADLCAQLIKYGAERVEYVDIPEGLNADDFIVAHGWEAFEKLPCIEYKSSATFDVAKHTESVAALLERDIEEVRYLIYNLLARGAASILGGPPKGFKSTLALYLALVLVGALRSTWDKFPVKVGKARVAYLDLEQTDALFQERLLSFKPDKTRVKHLYRLGAFPKLDGQGIAKLRELITSKRLDLVIIDTLARVRHYERGRSASDSDAELLDPVTKLAHETGCHILILAHNGKRKDHDNPIEMLAATSALAGAVDDVLVISKPPVAVSEMQRNLYVTGRHIREPGSYVIERTSTGFDLLGEASELLEGRVQKLVAAVLRDSDKPLTPSQIAKQLAGENISRLSVQKVLPKLSERGVTVSRNGMYTSTGKKMRP